MPDQGPAKAPAITFRIEVYGEPFVLTVFDPDSIRISPPSEAKGLLIDRASGYGLRVARPDR